MAKFAKKKFLTSGQEKPQNNLVSFDENVWSGIKFEYEMDKRDLSFNTTGHDRFMIALTSVSLSLYMGGILGWNPPQAFNWGPAIALLAFAVPLGQVGIVFPELKAVIKSGKQYRKYKKTFPNEICAYEEKLKAERDVFLQKPENAELLKKVKLEMER